MGWGTFVAGRVLGPRRRRGVTKRDIETAEMLNRKINSIVGPNKKELETEVLREIKRLKSEGKDVDIDALREVIRNRFKAYDRLGPKLELEIIRISQLKALAGEEVNYAEIQREILDATNKNLQKVSLVEEEFPSPSMLLPQEEILITTNTVLLTSNRVLKLSFSGKINREILLEDVKRFSTTRKKFATAGPLLIETKSGQSQNFGNLSDRQYQEFERVLGVIHLGSLLEVAKLEEKPKLETEKRKSLRIKK